MRELKWERDLPPDILAWLREAAAITPQPPATGEDLRHPITDWRHAVANGDTLRGYWEWAQAKAAASLAECAVDTESLPTEGQTPVV